MDVFIGNLPSNSHRIHFENFLRGVLGKLAINTFECRKFHNQTFAIVSFLHVKDGQLFLRTYGGEVSRPSQQTQHSGQLQYLLNLPAPVRSEPLRYLSAYLNVKPGNKSPDQWTLKSLARQEKKSNAQPQSTKVQNGFDRGGLQSSSLLCGTWDYAGTSPIFTAHTQWSKDWIVRFGKRNVTLCVGKQEFRVQIAYSSIYDITFESGPSPSITLTLYQAPFMSEGMPDAWLLFEALAITTENKPENKATRVCFLSPEHESLVSTCLVYRLFLQKSISQAQMTQFLTNKNVGPAIMQHTGVQSPNYSLSNAFRQLLSSLANPPYGPLPFRVKFQVQKLASNGYLQPALVRELLPDIAKMVRRSGGSVASLALRKLFNDIPFAGPETAADDLSRSAIINNLRKNEKIAKKEVSLDMLSKGASENVAIVYRATVTPAGVYLYGPEAEAQNRVLRKYSKNIESFLRVTFSDEDSSQVRFNPKVSNDKIFYNRFVQVLQQGIEIAGKKYSFLGFSHSSLRAQSCWFMAPFFDETERSIMLDRMVIERLGDFSHIRCPAKCAARIGQAFSDSREVVTLDPGIVRQIPDVERNGRTFSDGVGTLSPEILDYVTQSLSSNKRNQPTCFQIRYKGAKGMISLDSRLKGKCVVLRPSMVKFSGSDGTDNNIEICGSSTKPLRIYLNRQLIKILEDCGVKESWFLGLQRSAVEELRCTTQSAINAATFLETRLIGRSFYLPWFIRKLNALGMPFQEDHFLNNVVEMTVLVELRSLKYRSRIPVNMGHTLYGIMDETGTLEEGEVFVVTSTDSGKIKVLVGKNIIVTRSPALHPGDVQLVTAVDVPHDHPLRKLSNCICFSQKGDRDLPSQLSGGDLDGDLYHIIYDSDATLKWTYKPADYPRAEPEDIGRPVTKDDMINFFVTFMATDQLGRIATRHQVLADKEELGTLSPNCLVLADMHSTAVDYSKTGIPVNLKLLPKTSAHRPDFMAGSPHVIVEKKTISLVSQIDNEEEDEEDEADGFTEYKYYESTKILGKLYRDIDELEIFDNIQRKPSTHPHEKRDFIDELWLYIQKRCSSIEWAQHVEWANDIRDWYEDTVLTIMSEYAPNHRHPLSELEVFIGQIVGKNTSQNKRHRDLSVSMKERFDESVAATVEYILRDDNTMASDSLERSMACLAVALGPGKKTRKGDPLVSFKYIAASVCLKEAERAWG